MYTNNLNIPFPFNLWLAENKYDYNDTIKNHISTTELIQPLRILLLYRKYKESEKINIDISSLINMKEGSDFHESIERAILNNENIFKYLPEKDKINKKLIINPDNNLSNENSLNIYLEKRFFKEILGYTISGKVDMIFDETLYDHKKVKVFSYLKGISAKNYVLQASIYRWLAPKLITNDIFYINYFFKDWEAFKVGTSDYPKTQLLQKAYTLLSFKETENYIKNKIKAIINFEQNLKDDLPLCSKEDRWVEPTVYKYYTDFNNKAASNKYFTKVEALQKRKSNKGKGVIKEFIGTSKRCLNCIVKDVCKQYKDMDLK